jgi:hypothetical protein
VTTGRTSAALARKGELHRGCFAMLQVTVRSGGAERRVSVCRQCHRTCLANRSLRHEQQQQFAADSSNAIGKHWLVTWLSCNVLNVNWSLHESLYSYLKDAIRAHRKQTSSPLQRPISLF